MEAALTEHDDAQERLARANTDDARQRAAYKVEDAAEVAAMKVENDARLVAAALTSEVSDLRKEITILQQIDHFKGKVYVVAVIFGILVSVAFAGLWWVNNDVDNGVRAIRTDLEVHRIRNEASHDCLAEKMAILPPPEARTNPTSSALRQFVQEFLGCVTEVAPNIVPPGAPDLRLNPRKERQGD